MTARKKLEGDYQELEMLLEGATHAKEDLLKQNKKLQAALKDFQVLFSPDSHHFLTIFFPLLHSHLFFTPSSLSLYPLLLSLFHMYLYPPVTARSRRGPTPCGRS